MKKWTAYHFLDFPLSAGFNKNNFLVQLSVEHLLDTFLEVLNVC